MQVDGELAEAVADVMARFAPHGVVTEQGIEFLSDEDQGTAAGAITVRAYLPVDDELAGRRQQLEQSLFYLGMIRPVPAPTYREIADQNWMQAWKANYRPISIGRRLLILPAWMDSPDPQRIAIRIDPGMAFGTGTHPSTQLCLELLERCLDAQGRPRETGPTLGARPPGSVIDIGCGSGILSIAAVKLGALPVVGVDTDSGSLENARANAAINEIQAGLALGHGSVREVLLGDFGLRSASVVVANILAPVLIRLLETGLAELLDPDGALILGGILGEQAQGVIAAARTVGLELSDTLRSADWIALQLKRPAAGH
jgi:ribosomal protein L11 methyltransferase